MKMIGLAGPAGVGKDTIADYLVDTYNFTKFSFSDMLYEEVAVAFGIGKEALYDRATKERPSAALQYWCCKDKTFQNLMFHLLKEQGVEFPMDHWCSPRWVLQRWGTDYRRKQDPEYWIKRADQFVQAYSAVAAEDQDFTGAGLVNCSVRFPNERAFIAKYNGEVWHVRRPGWGDLMGVAEKTYVAEQGLPVEPEDKEITNGHTIGALYTATSLLLGSQPGTKIAVNVPTGDFQVGCVNCGKPHLAYTEAQVKQEIEEYNEWMQLNASSAALAANTALTVEDFRACEQCGHNTFTPLAVAVEETEDNLITPVIYEGPRA
jgi:hypothetical protein